MRFKWLVGCVSQAHRISRSLYGVCVIDTDILVASAYQDRNLKPVSPYGDSSRPLCYADVPMKRYVNITQACAYATQLQSINVTRRYQKSKLHSDRRDSTYAGSVSVSALIIAQSMVQFRAITYIPAQVWCSYVRTTTKVHTLQPTSPKCAEVPERYAISSRQQDSATMARAVSSLTMTAHCQNPVL